MHTRISALVQSQIRYLAVFYQKYSVQVTRLNGEVTKREFNDFNESKKLNGTGRAEFMISSSTHITRFPCQTMSFLVAKGGNFHILLGSSVIKKEKLLCKHLEPPREGVFPAVLTDCMPFI